MATLETRPALLSDASIMSRLCLLMGYDSTEVLMRQRLTRLLDDPRHAVFVAALDGGTVVGWTHVEIRSLLTGEPYADVLALAVSTAHRRLGIGRALCDRVDTWANDQQLHEIRARAQAHRADALTFYEGLGFELHKEHQVYRRLRHGHPDAQGPATIVD